MKVIIADDSEITVKEEDVRRAIDAHICRYIHCELHTGSGYWQKRGTQVLDEMIREAVSREVKGVIACQLDKIVKKAITNTAISIRNNPKHDVIREAVADALAEADTPQTESTGSPIGDYRDGVGAWQTDCGWSKPNE